MNYSAYLVMPVIPEWPHLWSLTRRAGVSGNYGFCQDVLIPEHATVSRLRPIQDGLDYWEEHGRCAATGLGGPTPG
jgi:hypothetical protein